jgi:hypothetical protein
MKRKKSYYEKGEPSRRKKKAHRAWFARQIGA